MKDKSISKLKKKLWSLVSKYVRLKHSDEWHCNICYTCGIRKHWKDMQAGHGFSGRSNAFLFELDIIRPQCYGCNICNSGKLDVFVEKLRKELGKKRFDELWKLKNAQRKFAIYELEEMIEDYKRKLSGYED